MKTSSRQSVQVESDIAAAYKQVADQAQISVSEVIRRVGYWLAKQPDYILGEVLGTTPPSLRGDVAKMILDRVVMEQSATYGTGIEPPPPTLPIPASVTPYPRTPRSPKSGKTASGKK